MLYAYILENSNSEEKRDNQSLFQLIEQMEIEDNNLFFDMDSEERTELLKLYKLLQPEDRLVIRSVLDIADSIEDLIKTFSMLTKKKISLCSCEEPFLSGEDFYNTLKSYMTLHRYFLEKKKQIAYKRAVAEGRVGRPKDSEEYIVQDNIFLVFDRNSKDLVYTEQGGTIQTCIHNYYSLVLKDKTITMKKVDNLDCTYMLDRGKVLESYNI